MARWRVRRALAAWIGSPKLGRLNVTGVPPTGGSASTGGTYVDRAK